MPASRTSSYHPFSSRRHPDTIKIILYTMECIFSLTSDGAVVKKGNSKIYVYLRRSRYLLITNTIFSLITISCFVLLLLTFLSRVTVSIEEMVVLKKGIEVDFWHYFLFHGFSSWPSGEASTVRTWNLKGARIWFRITILKETYLRCKKSQTIRNWLKSEFVELVWNIGNWCERFVF